MSKTVSVTFLVYILFATTASVATTTKNDLETVVLRYEAMAAQSKQCYDSKEMSSEPCKVFLRALNAGKVSKVIEEFTPKLNTYFGIDQELAMRGVSAIGTISDTFTFVLEQQNEKLDSPE